MKKLKISVLIGIFSIVVASVVGFSVFEMYRAAMEEERAQLMESVVIQAQLINSVARFDAAHGVDEFSGGAFSATFSQVKDAYFHLVKDEQAAEMVLGKHDGGQIVFVLCSQSAGSDLPLPIPFSNSSRAEPMRRALRGETGTVIAEDYNGQVVLAAYTLVEELNLGLVQKRNLHDLRAPYLHSGLLSAGGAVFVIILGSLLLYRLMNSIHRLLSQQANEVIERETRLRGIMDHAVCGIISINQDGLIRSLNPAAEQLFGFTEDEVIDRDVGVLMPAAVATEYLGYLTDYMRTGERKIMDVSREVEGQRKDGTAFPMELTVSETAVAGGKIFTGFVRDLTERYENEAALREREARLSAILENAVDGIITINPMGTVESMNPAAERIFGYDDEDVIGRNIKMLMPNPYHQEHDGYLANYRKTCTRRIIGIGREVTGLRKDGTTFPMDLAVSEVVTPEGWIFTGIVRDITDQKQAEIELLTAKNRAEESDRLKSAFLAVMSHELRTPLNSIIGFTGVILQGLSGPMTAEQEKQMGMVQRSARHLLTLINDVLDLSKIEAGQLTVQQEWFDLREAITAIAGGVSPLAKEKGLSLSVNVAPEIGMVRSDRRRVEQIFINLINNAIKFTEAGSVSLDCTLQEGAVVARVVDTGPGIKPADLAELFKPFRQVDSGLNRNHEGTGLGLSICRKLADVLGGTIAVESEWGKGSTFIFTFPEKKQGEENV